MKNETIREIYKNFCDDKQLAINGNNFDNIPSNISYSKIDGTDKETFCSRDINKTHEFCSEVNGEGPLQLARVAEGLAPQDDGDGFV